MAFSARLSSGLYVLVVASPVGLWEAVTRPAASLVHVQGVLVLAATALAVLLAGVPASV